MNIGSALEILFWLCVTAVVYHYAGYPLLLFIVAELSQAKSDILYLTRRVSRRTRSTGDYVPRVAVLVSAYNEEMVIEAKLKNTLALDYPADRLEFLFGLDAPTDSTADLTSQFQGGQVRVFPFETRRGKLGVLADLAQRTSAEILVLTDANTMLDRHCVRNLARHFADPKVGAVSGEEVRLVASGGDPAGESMYWRYESALKILESRLNCSLGGNGSALAVRRSLFQPKRHSIVEDFQIPMEIRFQGYRVIYDPEAVAVEEIAPTFAAQFSRRVRIGAGNYQTLFANPGYLNPTMGLLSFCFFSHRVLRWLVPGFLFLAFLCSVLLAGRPAFVALLVAQCTFYGMAVLGYWCKQRKRTARIFSVPLHFCSMNLALFLGMLRYLSGKQTAVWNSTPRTGDAMLLNRAAIGEGANSANR